MGGSSQLQSPSPQELVRDAQYLSNSVLRSTLKKNYYVKYYKYGKISPKFVVVKLSRTITVSLIPSVIP